MRFNRILGSHNLLSFVKLLFVFVFLLSIITFYKINLLHRHHRSSNEDFHHLIENQKVLVPVSINHLYDYRVVCSGKDGLLDPTNSIKQLREICQTILNGNLTIDLKSPDRFQLHSLLALEHMQRTAATTIDTCPVFQNESIAIVIAYRNREDNLRKLLYNLLPLLKQQKISVYKIFIIEQQSIGPFNKGRLYNIAFNHLMRTYKPTCVIFHDVDLIPENDQNLYSCYSTPSDRPIHMSAHVRFEINGSYTRIYSFLVGGVLAIRPKIFKLLNGYSNRYFNWGGEDDDMGLRFLSKNICVRRPTVGYYYAGPHSRQTKNKHRFRLLFDAVLRQDIDGLNNIDQLATIIHTQDYLLVTWLTVKWLDSTLHDLLSLS